MSAKTHRKNGGLRTAAIILAIAVCGPALGLLLFAVGLVLAPPWTFLSGLIYLPVACLALPVGLAALASGRIGGWGLLVSLLMASVAALFYLAIIGPGLPTDMTDCRPINANGWQSRYRCVSTSSDDTSYRHEFTLEGPPGSPLMRIVDTP